MQVDAKKIAGGESTRYWISLPSPIEAGTSNALYPAI